MRFDYLLIAGGVLVVAIAKAGFMQGLLIGVPVALLGCVLQWMRTDMNRAVDRSVHRLIAGRRRKRCFRSLFELLGALCCDERSGRPQAVNGLSWLWPKLALDGAQVECAAQAFEAGRESAPDIGKAVRRLRRVGRSHPALKQAAVFALIDMLEQLKPVTAADEQRLQALAQDLGLPPEAVSRERAIHALQPLDAADPPRFDAPDFESVGACAAQVLDVAVDDADSFIDKASDEARSSGALTTLERYGWPPALASLASKRADQFLKAHLLLISHRAWTRAGSSAQARSSSGA